MELTNHELDVLLWHMFGRKRMTKAEIEEKLSQLFNKKIELCNEEKEEDDDTDFLFFGDCGNVDVFLWYLPTREENKVFITETAFEYNHLH